MTSKSFDAPPRGVDANKAGVEPDDDMLGSLPKFISPLSFGCDLFKIFAACLSPLGNFFPTSSKPAYADGQLLPIQTFVAVSNSS